MFQNTYRSRILIISVVIVLLFILIIGRIFFIQVIDYKKLNSLANDLWSRNLPIGADRGLITDRNGVVLAENITTTSLVVVPNQIIDKELTAKKLSEILNTDYDDMLKHLNKGGKNYANGKRNNSSNLLFSLFTISAPSLNIAYFFL